MTEPLRLKAQNAIWKALMEASCSRVTYSSVGEAMAGPPVRPDSVYVNETDARYAESDDRMEGMKLSIKSWTFKAKVAYPCEVAVDQAAMSAFFKVPVVDLLDIPYKVSLTGMVCSHPPRRSDSGTSADLTFSVTPLTPH